MAFISPKCPYCDSRDTEKKRSGTTTGNVSGESKPFIINPVLYVVLGIIVFAAIRFGGNAIVSSLNEKTQGSGELLGMILIFIQVAFLAVLAGIFPKVQKNYNFQRKRFGKTWFCESCNTYFKA